MSGRNLPYISMSYALKSDYRNSVDSVPRVIAFTSYKIQLGVKNLWFSHYFSCFDDTQIQVLMQHVVMACIF